MNFIFLQFEWLLGNSSKRKEFDLAKTKLKVLLQINYKKLKPILPNALYFVYPIKYMPAKFQSNPDPFQSNLDQWFSAIHFNPTLISGSVQSTLIQPWSVQNSESMTLKIEIWFWGEGCEMKSSKILKSFFCPLLLLFFSLSLSLSLSFSISLFFLA